MTSHYTLRRSVTTLHDFGGVSGRPLGHLLLGSHNFTVTALGSGVKRPYRNGGSHHIACRTIISISVRHQLSHGCQPMRRVTRGTLAENWIKFSVPASEAPECHGSTEGTILTMVINTCTLPPTPGLPDGIGRWRSAHEFTFSPDLQPWTVGCQQKE